MAHNKSELNVPASGGRSWWQHSQLYLKPRVASIFFLGFSSGLPFLLLLSTLTVWLTEAHISKTQIGLLAWVTVPYSLKFMWAPIVSQIHIPYLCDALGRRRGWLVATQLGLMVGILGLGLTHPESHLGWTAFWAAVVGLFSAWQDIWIESYRIDRLPEHYLGVGAGASVLGYRVGMLTSGAGALYLSNFFSWSIVYTIMAGFILLGLVTTLCSDDEQERDKLSRAWLGQAHCPKPKLSMTVWYQAFCEALKVLCQNHTMIAVLVFIFCFKACDAILNVMNLPFLIEMGFSKLEIVHVSKTFGISAMIVGGIMGGLFVNRCSLWKSLWVCACLQVTACLLFVAQAVVGHHIWLLVLTTGVENFTLGLSQIGLIAYLTQLCDKSYSITHFAILSSLASLARVLFSMGAGWLADQCSWVSFYGFATLLCLPSLLLLSCCSAKFGVRYYPRERPVKHALAETGHQSLR